MTLIKASMVLALILSTTMCAQASCDYDGWSDPEYMHPCTYDDRFPQADSLQHTETTTDQYGNSQTCTSTRMGNHTQTYCQ